VPASTLLFYLSVFLKKTLLAEAIDHQIPALGGHFADFFPKTRSGVERVSRRSLLRRRRI